MDLLDFHHLETASRQEDSNLVAEVKYGERILKEETVHLLRVLIMQFGRDSVSETGDADVFKEVDTGQVEHEESSLLENLHQFYDIEALIVLRIVYYLILSFTCHLISCSLQTFVFSLSHLHMLGVLWDVRVIHLRSV